MVGSLVCVIPVFYGCIFLHSDLLWGGLPYDNWWNVSAVLDPTEPMGDHPLYPDVGENLVQQPGGIRNVTAGIIWKLMEPMDRVPKFETIISKFSKQFCIRCEIF
ncbi:MAG: hypothetical protein JRI87_05385 [Deltaproteobacteria bacterium]|nr:hypothetical protein [Deltaproteobacteria bacterium]